MPAAITYRNVLTPVTLCIILVCAGTPAWAQKNNRRNDERRENERVKNAQEHLQQTQKNQSELSKQVKTAASAVTAAERTVKLARDKVRDEKENAEQRLDSKSGIPQLIEKLKVARADFEKLAAPIRESVHATEAWQAAELDAKEAQAEKSEVLETVKDLKERAPLLEPLEKRIAKPLDMETTAILADSSAKRASDTADKLKVQLDELRKKFPDSKIDEDPLVKKAKTALDDAEKKLQQAVRELQSNRSKLAKAQASVADAQRKLNQAKEADRKNK